MMIINIFIHHLWFLHKNNLIGLINNWNEIYLNSMNLFTGNYYKLLIVLSIEIEFGGINKLFLNLNHFGMKFYIDVKMVVKILCQKNANL